MKDKRRTVRIKGKVEKRKRRVHLRVVPCFLFLLFLLVGVGFFFYQDLFFDAHSKDEVIPTPTMDVKPTKTPEEKVSKLSLIMVGDALIHSALYQDAKIDGGYDFKPMLAQLKPIISSYDLAYYNQETILGGTELGLSTYPRFNSPYEVGDAFIDCGFNLVSLSTNHTLDRGEQAILNSRAYWNRHEDVLATGSYASFEERNQVVVKEKNGIKYAMLSYTDLTNGLKVPMGKEYLVNIYEEEQVKKDIEAVRDQVDLLLVSMHFGTEYSFGVSERQRAIATYLADLGVDIVIGTHPHVVEPIEFIDDTMVIYSLGNFISAQRGVEKLTGLMASVEVKKVEKDGTTKVTLENPAARLVYTYSKGTSASGRYDFVLYPYSSLNDQLLKGYQTYYRKYMDIVNQNGVVTELDFIS